MMTADNKHQAIATQGGHTPHDSSAGPTAAAVFAKHILGKYFVTPAARRGPSLVLRMLRAGRSAGGLEATKGATAGSQAASAGSAAARLVPTVGRRSPSPLRAAAGIPDVSLPASVIAPRLLVQRKPMLRPGDIRATGPTLVAPLALGVAVAQPLAARAPSGDRSPPPSTALSPPVSSLLVRRPYEPAAAKSTSAPDNRDYSIDRVASRPMAISGSGPAPLTAMTLSRPPVDSAAEIHTTLFPATDHDSQRAVAGADRTPPSLPHRPATALPIPATSLGVSAGATPYATPALRPGLFRRVSVSGLRPLVQRKPMLRRLGAIGATPPTSIAPPALGVAFAQPLAARMARAVAVLGGVRSPPPSTALSPPVSSLLVRRPYEPVAAKSTSTPGNHDYSIDRVAPRPMAIAVSGPAPLTPLTLSRPPVDSTAEIHATLFPATNRDSQRAVAGADRTPPSLPHRPATALQIPAASIDVSAGPTPYATSALPPGRFRRVSVSGLRPLVQRRPLSHRNTGASTSKAVSQPFGLNPAAPHQELSAASLFSLGSGLSLSSGPARPLTLGGFRHFVQHALLGRHGADTVLDASAPINTPAADRLQAFASTMPTAALVYGRGGVHSRTGGAQPAVRPAALRAVPGRPLPAAVVRAPHANDAVPTMTHRLDAPAAAQPRTTAALTLQKPRVEVAQIPTLLSATLGAAVPAAQAASMPDSGAPSVVSTLSIEALADRIFHILERRLVVERERRGIRP